VGVGAKEAVLEIRLLLSTPGVGGFFRRFGGGERLVDTVHRVVVFGPEPAVSSFPDAPLHAPQSSATSPQTLPIGFGPAGVGTRIGAGLFDPLRIHAPPQHVVPNGRSKGHSGAHSEALAGPFMQDRESEVPRMLLRRTPVNRSSLRCYNAKQKAKERTMSQ
jgi:hypothetical protein